MARPPAWRRYARLFGVDVRSDVDEELRFHLEEKTRALIDRGATPDQARAAALREFGEVAEVRRLCQELGQSRERTIERRHYWSGWTQDLRYAVRTLRTAPLVTAVAVASIALGIGANTAIFTLLDQVLLRTLPVEQPERIVRVATTGFYYGSTYGTGRELPYPLYVELRDRNRVLQGLFGFFPFGAALNEGARADMVQGELVTGNYFSTLRIGAIRGRVIGPDDDRVPGAHSVAVISHAFWQSRFGGDPQIVGRKLTLGTFPLTIVGVVEPAFHGFNLGVATQVFVPVSMEAQVLPSAPRLPNRGLRWLKVFARLNDGVTMEQAKASLETLYRPYREQDLNDPRYARAAAFARTQYLNENHVDVVAAWAGYTPMRARLAGPLWVLMAVVCGVLLIACANVANLLLARGASRQREIAVRLSLGATRGRIVRQLLVESVLLAAIGGAIGTLLAVGGVRLLLDFMAGPDGASLIRATPDWRILTFTSLVALATGLLFGVVPALQSTRPALAPTLKDQATSVAGGSQVRVRKALVVSQVAVSLVLLVGAGLFIRSLNRLMAADLGFRSEGLVSFVANPTAVGFDAERSKQHASDVLAALRRTPGVTAAAVARLGLLQGGAWSNSIAVEGYRPKGDEEIGSRLNGVSPGYFTTMGIPLLMGRDFVESDRRTFAAGEPVAEADEGYRVAIVSESFAKRYFVGSPIGRHIGLGADPGTPTPIEIVGVVKDSVYTSPTEDREWQIYVPFFGSRDAASGWYYVRTSDAPEPLLPTVRRVAQQVDPSVPVLQLRTMEAQVGRSLVSQRLVTGLSTLFGVLATLLAMVGLYGVLAYTVTRRTREIGVRMALGAVAPGVVWLILRDALKLIVAGVVLALPMVWWLGRYIGSQLHGVDPADPATIGVAVLALATVAAAAGLIPAARAARINPIRALRQE